MKCNSKLLLLLNCFALTVGLVSCNTNDLENFSPENYSYNNTESIDYTQKTINPNSSYGFEDYNNKDSSIDHGNQSVPPIDVPSTSNHKVGDYDGTSQMGDSKPNFPDPDYDTNVPNKKENVRDYVVTDLPKYLKPSDFRCIGSDQYAVASFAIDCIAYQMTAQGFEVFRAYACIDFDDTDNKIDHYVMGLAFTNNDVYTSDGEQIIYSCGFMQTISAGETTEYIVKPEDFAGGVCVLNINQNDKVYVCEGNIPHFEGFGGILDDTYFVYQQEDDFVISISVRPNKEKNYDLNYDIYDYDNCKYIYKADIFGDKIGHINAFNVYGNRAAQCYSRAIELIEKTIALQDSNGVSIKQSTVSFVDAEILKLMEMQETRESVAGFLTSEINKMELGANEYVVFDKDENGNPSVTIKSDAVYASASDRKTSGLVKTLTNLLLVGGSALLIVSTAGAALPIAAIGISTSVSTLAYSCSELLEGVQELEYALDDDITSVATNPVKDIFTATFDEKLGAGTGAKLYHIWGIFNTVLGSIITPVSTALQNAVSISATYAETVILVARSIVIHAIKTAITAGASALATVLVNNIVLKFTGNETLALVSGLLTTVVVSSLVYKGLDSLDKKYGWSFPKSVSGKPVVQKVGRDELDELTKKGDKDYAYIYRDSGDGNTTFVPQKRNDATKTFDMMKTQKGLKTKLEYVNFSDNEMWPTLIYEPQGPFMMMAKRPIDAKEYQDEFNGFYDPTTDTIYINFRLVIEDSTLAFYTMAHMIEHAYQYQNAEVGSAIYNALLSENYRTASEDINSFSANLAEKDANDFADYMLKRAKHAADILFNDGSVEYVENIFTEVDNSTLFQGGK